MKKINNWTVFGFTLAVCAFFVTCSNPILETWWPGPTDPGDPTTRQAFHVVRFNENGGFPIIGDQLIADGEKVAKIQAVSREHYGFGGWFANADLTGNPWDFTGNTVTRGLMLYARWIPIPCVITFEANGGEPVPEKQLLVSGTKIGEPLAMNLDGRGFGGWFRDELFVNEWNFAIDTATGDLTLYAKWESIHHAVTFEAGGGRPAPETGLVAHGARIVVPQAMTMDNYGFGGWFTDSGLTREWNFAVDTVTESLTLYAKWEPDFHTVRFLVNSGFPVPTDLRIAHGAYIPRPAPVSRAGFSFGGWFTDSGFANEWNFALNTVSGDMTLHARWERTFNVFTVTFNADPGVSKTVSLASPWPDAQRVVEGTRITEPESLRKPVAPGVESWYGFGGWFTDAALTDKWNFSVGTVDRDLTLYAKWDAFHCTVTFEANGGIPAPEPQDLIEGANVKEPLAMTRAGHGFGGWFSNEVFSRKWDFSVDVVTAATSNLTLYARWVANFYRITFEANGGIPAPTPQTVAQGGLVTPPLPMTKTGMGFAGWYADAGFRNAWDFDTPVTMETTLYAKWDQSYVAVNFVATPSQNPPAQSVAFGTKAVQPTNPMAPGDGRSFDGWFTENGAGGNWGVKWNFANDIVTEPVTLFAKWVYQTRTVVFKVNGGLTTSGTEMRTNFTIPVASGVVWDPGSLVRTGYSFGGWFTDLQFTDPWNFSVDRITEVDAAPGVDPFYLYAKWTAIPYLVSFDVHNIAATQPAAQQIAHGERVERPVATTVAEVLAGWYTEAEYYNEWNF
ncbi:MAG: InlB B-repeat-containing protein, partial [Treponema sp.]|nr:InlB B-repeat-containing protein [Treponema sp.]